MSHSETSVSGQPALSSSVHFTSRLTITLCISHGCWPGSLPGDPGCPLPDLRSWSKVSGLCCLVSEMVSAIPACPPPSITVGNSQEARWEGTESIIIRCTSGSQSVAQGPGALPSPGSKGEEQALRLASGRWGGRWWSPASCDSEASMSPTGITTTCRQC